MSKNKMKAPSGVHTALVEGHTYDVPKSGVITVISPTHLNALKRLDFQDHYEEEKDVAGQIDAMDDKDDLVEFIEERGGDASNTMGLKKLKRLAREAAGIGE